MGGNQRTSLCCSRVNSRFGVSASSVGMRSATTVPSRGMSGYRVTNGTRRTGRGSAPPGGITSGFWPRNLRTARPFQKARRSRQRSMVTTPKVVPRPGATFAADARHERSRPRAVPLPRGALRRGRGALRARAGPRPGQPGLDRSPRQGLGQRHRRGRRVRPRAALLRRRRAAGATTAADAPQPAEPPRRSPLAPAPLLGRAHGREPRRRGVRVPHARRGSALPRPGVDELVPQAALPRHPHARVHAGAPRSPQPQVDLSRRTSTSASHRRASPRRRA